LAFVAALALALAACSGSGKRAATVTPVLTDAAATAVTAPPTPTPALDLAQRIGVRADLPYNDAIDLAARYGKTAGRAPAARPFAGEPDVGQTRDFVVARLTGAVLSHFAPPENVTVTATLLAKSAHAYFYVAAALGGDAAEVQAAADTFEASTWPTVTGVFGEPAIPGVDGDPRIIVLQADLGGAVGGYYSGDDGYLRSVRPLSNEAEMVYLDRTLRPGGAAFNVVLAHEFQHLIHAKNDPSEEAWVNEGLSENSLMLVGGAASSINSFAAKPETQLNVWDSEGSLPHYGAGAAFFRYLASRVGGDAVLGKVARAQHDGTAGVDEFLASTGQPLRFRDVFADWIVANALNREAGAYANPGRPITMDIEHSLAAGDTVDGEAHQFGTDYYSVPELDGSDYVLRFRGRTQVPVLPASALQLGPVMWANGEDDIGTRLTGDVDLTAAVAPSLTFRTWFDIERWYDWGYVSASTDGGATWTALHGQYTNTDDAVQVAYGPGYSGASGEGEEPAWLDERIDLAPYAGKQIKLRFEFVTDGGTGRAGWAVRDAAIGAGGGSRPSPLDLGGWDSEGWLNVDSMLPQTYIARLAATRASGEAVVLDVPLDASQAGELRFNSAGLQDVVVAIAGSTEGTDQLAPYTVELARP
jgi:hypothetical protein